MGHRLFADTATASGVRWLLVSLVLAAVGDLVLDVPYYLGAVLPGLSALSAGTSYPLYTSVLSVAVPTVIGPIGFVGILRIERGRGWTGEWRGERARPALFAAAAAAAFLFGSGLALALAGDPVEAIWNSVRMTARFVVVLAGGVYLFETAARIDPGSRRALAMAAFVVGMFAAAVRMLIAVYNGLVASAASADFVRSQVEPLLAPAAFDVELRLVELDPGLRKRCKEEQLQGESVVSVGRPTDNRHADLGEHHAQRDHGDQDRQQEAAHARSQRGRQVVADRTVGEQG